MKDNTLLAIGLVVGVVVLASLSFSILNLNNKIGALQETLTSLQKANDNKVSQLSGRVDSLQQQLQNQAQPSQTTPTQPPQLNEAGATALGVKVDLSGKTPRGDKDAKLSIIEFSDFECPFCGLVEPTLVQLLSKYNSSLNLYYVNLPLHAHSYNASEAYECALSQGKGWEMHDLLFQSRINANNNNTEPDFSPQALVGMAKQLNLDTNSFNTCLLQEQTKGIVDADMAQSQKLFTQLGTPTFIINCNEYEGAMPYDSFKKVIDYELNHTSTCQ